MRDMIGSLMRSENSLKISQDELGRANVLGVPIQISEGDRIKIYDGIYDLTPEIYKALSDTGHTGKNMQNENVILMMNNIKRYLVYTRREDGEFK